MADFLPVFDDFFMEYINIGSTYYNRMGGRDVGVGWVVAKAKIKKQDDTNSRA